MRSIARSLLVAAALLAPSLAQAQARPTPIDQVQMTPIAASTCSPGKSCVYWSSVDGKLHQRNALGVDTTIGSGGGGGGGAATSFQTSAGAPSGAATADVWFDTNANSFCGRWSGSTSCFARLGANSFTGDQTLQAAASTVGTTPSPVLDLAGTYWTGSASADSSVTLGSNPSAGGAAGDPALALTFRRNGSNVGSAYIYHDSIFNEMVLWSGYAGHPFTIVGVGVPGGAQPGLRFDTDSSYGANAPIYDWSNDRQESGPVIMTLADNGSGKGVLGGLASITGLVPVAAGNSGKFSRSDGSNWVAASLTNSDLPASGLGVITNCGDSTHVCRVSFDAKGIPTAATAVAIAGGGGGGSGTVTSVDLSLPAIFSVSGNPVTDSGTIAATLVAQAANRVWAGPTTGADAAPTFRLLVVGDIPDLSSLYASLSGSYSNPSWITALAASKLSGQVAIANGGTGAATTSQAFAFIGPTSGSGAPSFRALVSGDIPDISGTYAALAGSYSNPSWITALAASKLTGQVAIANGGWGGSTTSQNFVFAGPTSGSGAPSMRALVTGDIPSLSSIYQPLATPLTQLAAISGVRGDLLYYGASGWTRLAKSPNVGDVLTQGASDPGWAASAGGAPSGAAGGDLSGTYPNPGVGKVNGIAWDSTWNGSALPNDHSVPCFLTSNNKVQFCDTAVCLAHQAVWGQGSAGPTCGAALTNGQLYIGSTGNDPVAASIANGGGITATSGAGTITLGSSCGGDLSGTVAAATVAKVNGVSVAAPTTKGDIWATATGPTVNRLAVGTDGQVLTADSASTNGVKWATPGGGSLPDPVTVAHGGTGLTTLTAHALYCGNGTGNPTALSVGSTNQVLLGSTGADPAFGSLPVAALPAVKFAALHEVVTAACQAGTASLATSTGSSNAPTPVCIGDTTGANEVLGAAEFTATSQFIQGRLLLPDDWVSGSGNDLVFRFRSVGITGNTVWKLETKCASDSGAVLPTSWNTGQTQSVAAQGTTLFTNTTTLSTITTTGCSAGNLLYWKVTLDSSTTTTGNQDLFSLKFKLMRSVTFQ